MTLRVRIICLLGIFFAIIGMNGCSGGDGDAEATEPVVVSVDPTRASAKALFERVRTICDEEYPDAEAYYALVRTETPKQNAWLAFIHNIELPKPGSARHASTSSVNFRWYKGGPSGRSPSSRGRKKMPTAPSSNV